MAAAHRVAPEAQQNPLAGEATPDQSLGAAVEPQAAESWLTAGRIPAPFALDVNDHSGGAERTPSLSQSSSQ